MQTEEREEARDAVPATLAAEDQERHAERQQERGDEGGSAVPPQGAGEKIGQQHGGDSKECEGQARREGGRPEEREGARNEVEGEPRVPLPDVVVAVLDSELLGEGVRAVRSHRHAMGEDGLGDDGRLRFVLPQVRVAEVGEEQHGRQNADRCGANSLASFRVREFAHSVRAAAATRSAVANASIARAFGPLGGAAVRCGNVVAWRFRQACEDPRRWSW